MSVRKTERSSASTKISTTMIEARYARAHAPGRDPSDSARRECTCYAEGILIGPNLTECSARYSQPCAPRAEHVSSTVSAVPAAVVGTGRSDPVGPECRFHSSLPTTVRPDTPVGQDRTLFGRRPKAGTVLSLATGL